jgi:hypothetical protein
VLGGGRELDLLGREIDEAIVGGRGVVAAFGRVIVEVGADPAAGVDNAAELRSSWAVFLRDIDRLLGVVGSMPRSDRDMSRRKGLREPAVFE